MQQIGDERFASSNEDEKVESVVPLGFILMTSKIPVFLFVADATRKSSISKPGINIICKKIFQNSVLKHGHNLKHKLQM